MIIQYLTRKIDMLIRLKLQIRKLNDQFYTFNWNAKHKLLSANLLVDLKPIYVVALDLSNSLREYNILVENPKIKNLEKEYLKQFSKFSNMLTCISEGKPYENLQKELSHYCLKTVDVIAELNKSLPTITSTLFKSLWFSTFTFILGLVAGIFANLFVKLITM